MIDWTKPIETMEGWKAKVVSTDYKTISSTLYLVQMERPSGASILGWYREDGQPWETQTLLRNVKVKREGWVLMRPWSSWSGEPINIVGLLAMHHVYPSEEEAKYATRYFEVEPGTKPVHLTWEE
jgi:hypothetical protein